MIASRYTDQIQADAAQRGEVFFYIPSSGHEASALIAPHLIPSDWLHLHYRDRALAYARGVTYQTVFDGLFSRASSNSAGRRMPAFPSDRKLNIMSTPTLVGSNVVQAVGVAHTFKDEDASNSIVLASVGDGATQQGDFYEAVSEAARLCRAVTRCSASRRQPFIPRRVARLEGAVARIFDIRGPHL